MRAVAAMGFVALMAGSAAGAADDARFCQSISGDTRAAATASRDLLTKALAALPDDIEQRILDGDETVLVEEFESLDVPEMVGPTIRDYLLSAVRAIVPLIRYADSAEAAAAALEACASGS